MLCKKRWLPVFLCAARCEAAVIDAGEAVSSASRGRCNSMHRFGVRRLKTRSAAAGFLAQTQPSQAAQRGHGAPRAAQRSRSTRRWPVSRLPSQAAPSHERNGTLGHEPSARALSTLPARRRGLARARQLRTTSPLCNAKSRAREARITAPFRATRLIQTPAAAAAVTRASVRTRTA